MNGVEKPGDWRAQTLRLTLFCIGTLPGVDTLWKELTGREPDVDENRRAEGIRRLAGTHREGDLTINVGPGRVDVLMTPPTRNVAYPQTSFGSFDAEIEEFDKLLGPWLKVIKGEIVRVALGCVLLHPAADREASYKLFARYVPSVKLDAERSKEVLYRVNRPKKSAHVAELNRLTSWNPVVYQLMAGPASDQATRVSEEHFLRLEIDSSTPAGDTRPLKNETIAPIFVDLVRMAVENAAKGECS